jgi:hypothetical protein
MVVLCECHRHAAVLWLMAVSRDPNVESTPTHIKNFVPWLSAQKRAANGTHPKNHANCICWYKQHSIGAMQGHASVGMLAVVCGSTCKFIHVISLPAPYLGQQLGCYNAFQLLSILEAVLLQACTHTVPALGVS